MTDLKIEMSTAVSSTPNHAPSAGQACLCAPCRYFKVVLLPTGKVRNLCAFTGERLDAGGEPLCEFRHVEGGAA